MDSPDFAQAVKAGHAVVINQGKIQLWCCSARNENQVAFLKRHLGIPEKEGINVWVDNDQRLNQHMTEVSEAAWDLFDATEGEVTLLLPDSKNIAKSALFIDQTLAITFTKEAWAGKMMQWLKAPIAVVKAKDGAEVLPQHLQAEVYVLNLPAKIDPSILQGYSIIKLSADNEIKIIRNQGQKMLPHI